MTLLSRVAVELVFGTPVVKLLDYHDDDEDGDGNDEDGGHRYSNLNHCGRGRKDGDLKIDFFYMFLFCAKQKY